MFYVTSEAWKVAKLERVPAPEPVAAAKALETEWRMTSCTERLKSLGFRWRSSNRAPSSRCPEARLASATDRIRLRFERRLRLGNSGAGDLRFCSGGNSRLLASVGQARLTQ